MSHRRPASLTVLAALLFLSLLGHQPLFGRDEATTVVFRPGDEGYHSFRIPAVIVAEVVGLFEDEGLHGRS